MSAEIIHDLAGPGGTPFDFDGLDPDQARAYGLGHAGKPLDFQFSLRVEPQDEPLDAFKASLTRDLMMFAQQAERALSAWHKGTQDRVALGVARSAKLPTVEDAQFGCAGCGQPYALEGVQTCPSCEPKA